MPGNKFAMKKTIPVAISSMPTTTPPRLVVSKVRRVLDIALSYLQMQFVSEVAELKIFLVVQALNQLHRQLIQMGHHRSRQGGRLFSWRKRNIREQHHRHIGSMRG